MLHEIFKLDHLEHIAAIAAAGAVIYTARVGRREIGKWKEEKWFESRVEHAIKAIEMVHRASLEIRKARDPNIMPNEIDAAKSNLIAYGYSQQQIEKLGGAVKARVLFNRLNKVEDAIIEVCNYVPISSIIFGKKIGSKISALTGVYYRLRVDTKVVAFNNNQKCCYGEDLFFWDSDEEDEIEKELKNLEKSIEDEFQSLLGDDFSKNDQ